MSLKCGVGLNLTCANHVILCEPWWNPFAEEQAMDRAHRIGQTRPVRVVRLAIANTVEERVMKLQEDKRAAAAAALGGGGAASQRGLNRLSERDLRTLFGL
jgi:SNF2 family DNA or RNA helicase